MLCLNYTESVFQASPTRGWENKDVKPVRHWVYHNAPSAGVPQMDEAPAVTHSPSLGASHPTVTPTSGWVAREELWLASKGKASTSATRAAGQKVHPSSSFPFLQTLQLCFLQQLLLSCLGVPALPRHCIPFPSGSSLMKQQEQSCALCSSASASTRTWEDVFHRCLWFQKGNATSPGKIPWREVTTSVELPLQREDKIHTF